MSNLADLYRLQEIDLTWEKVYRRLVKLNKLMGGSEELKKVKEQVADTEESLQDWQAKQQDAELEARSLTTRIDDTEKRLMSGQVSNPKELESLQASAEALRRQKSNIEDRGVEALLKVEELSDQLAEQKSEMDQLESEWQSNQEALQEEVQQRKKEYVYLKRLREELTESLDADLLERYEHLRKRKHGIAIARLEGDTCGACHVQVPTGVIGTVVRNSDNDELVLCPACGRILYAE